MWKLEETPESVECNSSILQKREGRPKVTLIVFWPETLWCLDCQFRAPSCTMPSLHYLLEKTVISSVSHFNLRLNTVVFCHLFFIQVFNLFLATLWLKMRILYSFKYSNSVYLISQRDSFDMSDSLFVFLK
jgi:thiol-disulfide isomerase/thioredoxin